MVKTLTLEKLRFSSNNCYGFIKTTTPPLPTGKIRYKDIYLYPRVDEATSPF